MKLRTIFSAVVVAFAMVSMGACEKSGDTSKPVIEITGGEFYTDSDEVAFAPDAEICLEMDLSDDTSLGSFKINIHSNFDGHDHVSVVAKSEVADWNNDDAENIFSFTAISTDAEYVDNYDISGKKSDHVHFHIDIPEDVAYGDYHLMIYCYDSAGNGSYVAKSFQITADGEYYEDEHHHDDE